MAYLDRSPYENVFLSWAIASPTSPTFRERLYVYADPPNVEGVAFLGHHVVLAAQEEPAIDAFAGLKTATSFERMIVGPRRTVEQYWQRVAARHAQPRLVRESQPVLAVNRAELRGAPNGVDVRRARIGEWQTVAINSSAMIQVELGYDPRAGSAEFDANVRAAIERGTWWVGEFEQQICFYCSEGPSSSRTLQLQGIWTPPHLRRRGLASAALFGICARLLNDHPTLSLYVNDFNTAGLALYKGLGFRQVAEFTTLLF
ncbi:MAG TPA: GNAT family N-acetyltransferase [Candidatus Rubrimentiphilum sp.]|nr:GNAT family N-acetyltransferase [Candidatus Rubrimentiphilum sp.]